MPFIDGTEVDYVQEGAEPVVEFHNHEAQNECGCGGFWGIGGTMSRNTEATERD